MSTLSTHILDISTGRPAQGVKITLECEGAQVACGVTDDNGRKTDHDGTAACVDICKALILGI